MHKDACMCYADKSIPLFKCFMKDKLDDALSCIPNYIGIITNKHCVLT